MPAVHYFGYRPPKPKNSLISLGGPEIEPHCLLCRAEISWKLRHSIESFAYEEFVEGLKPLPRR